MAVFLFAVGFVYHETKIMYEELKPPASMTREVKVLCSDASCIGEELMLQINYFLLNHMSAEQRKMIKEIVILWDSPPETEIKTSLYPNGSGIVKEESVIIKQDPETKTLKRPPITPAAMSCRE